MKLKTGLAFMMSGVATTLLYQQIKNGNAKKFIDKTMKAERKMLDNLEDMM